MNKLAISGNKKGDTWYLTLEGDFNQYEGEEDIRSLDEAYRKILETSSQVDLILEFKTERIGTVGINTLTEIYEVVTENGGRLRFVSFPENEMKYLEITGFINYVEILSGIEEI